MAPSAHDLLRAYRQTRYRVHSHPQTIDLRIGVASPALDELLTRRGVATAAFLTACNPHSDPLPPPQNLARQQALLTTVRERGYRSLDAAGIADGGDWPPEESLLILGIDMETANQLAIEFGQYGYLWIVRGQPPMLALTSLWRENGPARR